MNLMFELPPFITEASVRSRCAFKQNSQSSSLCLPNMAENAATGRKLFEKQIHQNKKTPWQCTHVHTYVHAIFCKVIHFILMATCADVKMEATKSFLSRTGTVPLPYSYSLRIILPICIPTCTHFEFDVIIHHSCQRLQYIIQRDFDAFANYIHQLLGA